MEPDLIQTGDGSHSLFDPKTNDSFHSIHGAITESRYIFIDNGLKLIKKNNISVLEIGFGTGLNAYLSLLYATDSGKQIRFHSIEKYPLKKEIYHKLNYAKVLKSNPDIFIKLHQATWNVEQKITDAFSLHKIKADLTAITTYPTNYDLVMYDAFAPDKQPEMWSEDIIKLISSYTYPGSIWVTYTSKGTIKRILGNTGFRVERIAGPPGKRHILRGIKT